MTEVTLTRFAAADATQENVAAALEKDGAVIIENLADPALVERIRQEMQPWIDRTPPGEGLFYGCNTIRFGGAIVKAPSTQELCLNPLTMQVAEKILGPWCSSIQLNLSQAIAIGPDEPEQILHADDEMWRVPRDGTEYIVNAMWALTDFTKENGATRIVPGSHRDPIRREVDPSELAYAEMPAGSVVLWRGSALHGGGANHTNNLRVGVVMGYCLGWLRQSENQYLVAPPVVARSMPARLQQLLGYTIHEPNLGFFEGQDPSIALQDDALSSPLPWRDLMPPEMKDALVAYYGKEIAA